jgi:hypothetical protein
MATALVTHLFLLFLGERYGVPFCCTEVLHLLQNPKSDLGNDTGQSEIKPIVKGWSHLEAD